MSKLRFDPISYQFYFASRSEDGTRAKNAGFDWDPRRYCTGDPGVAMALASCGDNYVKHLLADALGATARIRSSKVTLDLVRH